MRREIAGWVRCSSLAAPEMPPARWTVKKVLRASLSIFMQKADDYEKINKFG
jgi:hypothetical protein